MKSAASNVGTVTMAAMLVSVAHYPTAASGTANQWTAIGPDTAYVYAVAVAPTAASTIYIGGDTLMKTTDGARVRLGC